MDTIPKGAVLCRIDGRVHFFLVWELQDPICVEAHVYEIDGWYDDETPSDISEAYIATMRMKWDGCSDVTMGYGTDGFPVHACGAEHMERLLHMLRWLWHECRNKLGTNYAASIGGELKQTPQ